MGSRRSFPLPLIIVLPFSTLLSVINTGTSACNNSTHYYDNQGKACCLMCERGLTPRNNYCARRAQDCAPCPANTYWMTKRGVPTCSTCNSPCQADQVQVQECAMLTNRVCKCKKGYFCKVTAQDTCRKCQQHSKCPPGEGVSQEGGATIDTECMPCPAGTYSNILSAEQRCLQHTNCSSLGRAVLQEGNKTHDSVCTPRLSSAATPGGGTKSFLSRGRGAPTTQHSRVITAAARRLAITLRIGRQEIPEDHSFTPYTVGIHPHPTEPAESTVPTKSEDIDTESTVQTKLQLSSTVPKSPVSLPRLSAPSLVSSTPAKSQQGAQFLGLISLVFLALLLVLAILLCVVCNRRRSLKSLLKWRTGLQFISYGAHRDQEVERGEKHPILGPHHQLPPERGPRVEAERPVTSERPGGCPLAELGEGGSGGTQQVIVDRNRGGDSVNNAVGSIYIISPGTVILGAKTEWRDEIEEKRTEVGEPAAGEALISFPQQESIKNPENEAIRARDPVSSRVCVQEEEPKDLCFPVPATSK
nr:PREDICTED: tumor necrosis factor receptor superfamily member 21-like isoform X1 [Lepisosteus oculatus]